MTANAFINGLAIIGFLLCWALLIDLFHNNLNKDTSVIPWIVFLALA